MEVKLGFLEVRRTQTECILLKWKFSNVLMGRTDGVWYDIIIYIYIYIYLFTKQIY